MAVFPVADENTNVLLMKGAKASAFGLGGVRFDRVAKGSKFFMTNVGPVEFEEHLFGDDEDKPVDDTPNTKVPVLMTTLSHGEYFDKYDYTPGSAAMELIRRFPEEIPGAIDKFLARNPAQGSAAWGGWTGTPAPIDGTAASFLAPQDALGEAGYEPTLSVWANQGKRAVRGILNENTQRSDAAVAVRDGVAVGDTTAYFRNLYTGALVDGARIGFILDPNFTRVFLGAPEKVVVVTEETDHTLARKNAFYAKVEIRIGIGTVQDSVIPLTWDAPAA